MKALKISAIYIALLLAVHANIFGSGPGGGLDKSAAYLQQKSMRAVKISTPPKIDGMLDDAIWQKAEIATDFIQYSPYNGKPSRYKTEVRILYDNTAIYFGAKMYDDYPDSIYTELGKRDADMSLNADQFTIDISPFNDGINGATFKISVSGVQSDRPPRNSTRRGGRGRGGGGMGYGGGGDSWDAVWESKTSIVEDGWIAEVKIPYSAIRFPAKDKQIWGINLWREVKRDRETSSWTFVDREVGSTFNHLGELIDIVNIEPPLRLSLTPYASAYLEKNHGDPKAGFTYNYGLDLKYGINESFTLDATLIPDFGQVRSDDQVLNLSPYEVKYNENRPFFMEGTELFSKGDVFYSRRIGARPKGYYAVYDSLQANEELVENPQEASLINATKISGRTKSGLGIGFFNAMTAPMHAIVSDTTDGGNTREVTTDPFTNYNMVVIDQSLKNNSYVSFLNTNVMRNAPNNDLYYTANVTGTDFAIYDKSRQYSFSGQAALTQKYYDNQDNEFGHAYQVRGGKTGGALRLTYSFEMSNDTYDPNDMGYLRRNNEFNNNLSVSYNIFQPFWIVLNQRNSISYQYQMLYKPRVFTGSEFNFSSTTTFKNFWSFTLRGEVKPLGSDDYFEPRVDGWFYTKGPEYNIMTWISTNRSDKVSAWMSASYTNIASDYDQSMLSLSFRPTIRFSDRYSLAYNIQYKKNVNDIGYVDYDSSNDLIYFGKRDNITLENTLESSYIFTADSYLSFRLRHYWSIADYKDDFFTLRSDGGLNPAVYTDNEDYSYNAFNIDLVYTWRFAPGSELSVVWKNSIYSGSDKIYYDFLDNLDNMFGSGANNSFSVKVLYYLDWLYLQKRR